MRSADLLLGSQPPDFVVRLEGCLDGVRAGARGRGECVRRLGCVVHFSKGAGEDQGVFEALACAGALVGSACVSDVAEQARQGVVVSRCGWVVENRPSSGFGELQNVRLSYRWREDTFAIRSGLVQPLLVCNVCVTLLRLLDLPPVTSAACYQASHL